LSVEPGFWRDDLTAIRQPLRAGEIGLDLFRAACGMGLEGLVSKRPDRP